jgi:hypothetical protein
MTSQILKKAKELASTIGDSAAALGGDIKTGAVNLGQTVAQSGRIAAHVGKDAVAAVREQDTFKKAREHIGLSTMYAGQDLEGLKQTAGAVLPRDAKSLRDTAVVAGLEIGDAAAALGHTVATETVAAKDATVEKVVAAKEATVDAVVTAAATVAATAVAAKEATVTTAAKTAETAKATYNKAKDLTTTVADGARETADKALGATAEFLGGPAVRGVIGASQAAKRLRGYFKKPEA